MRQPIMFHRVMHGLLCSLLAVMLLVTLAQPAHAQADWGARAAWALAKRVLPGNLKGEFVGATDKEGVELRNVSYSDDTRVVKVDRLTAAWHVTLKPLALEIRSLRMDTADVTLLPSPEPSPSPTLPQEIKLPLALDVRQAMVGKLVLHQDGETTTYSDIRLRASSDRVHHNIILDKAVTPYGTASATLQLNGTRPFAVNGKASLNGAWQQETYRLNAALSGNLSALGVQLDVASGKLNGNATVEATPFATVPFRRAQVDLHHLNPQAFRAGAPRADLDIQASLTPVEGSLKKGEGLSSLAVSGPISVVNAIPGGLDRKLLPLVTANAAVTLDAHTQTLSRLTINLPDSATLEGSGVLRTGAQGRRQGSFTLQANSLDLHALHATLRHTALNGPLKVALNGDRQQVQLALSGGDLSLRANADITPQKIALQDARVQAGQSRLALNGTLERGGRSAYAFNGTLSDFRPDRFLASMPVAAGKNGAAPDLPPVDALINADFQARGTLQPQLRADITLDVHDSTYAGLPMTGGGTLHLLGDRLLPSDLQLSVAGNEVVLRGGFGASSDRLNLHVDAPALDRLGIGLTGVLEIDGQVGGTFKRPLVDATVTAQPLGYGGYRVAQLSGRVQTQGLPGDAPRAPLRVNIDAQGVQGPDLSLANLQLDVDGSYASHDIRLAAAGRLRGEPLDLKLAAHGALQQQKKGGLLWDGVLRSLQSEGVLQAALEEPLPLRVGAGSVVLGASRLVLEQASVRLQGLRYEDGRLSSAGTFDALNVGRLLGVMRQVTGNKPPVNSTLVLDGRWDFTLADQASGFVEIARTGGDVSVPGPAGDTALGLTALSARADLQGERVQLGAHLTATRVGNADGQVQVMLQQVDGRLGLAPDAPLSGHITASIPRLQNVASLAGPRIALDGSLQADIAVGGTLADPSFNGAVTGDRIALTLYDQGVRLRDGTVRIALHDNIADLQEVVFHGGEGTLRVTGRIPLDSSAPDLSADIVADQLQLLATPDKRMTLSGRAQAAMVNEQLHVDGRFKVDRALFNLPEKTAPKLGDDVVIIRDGERQAKRPPGPRPASPWSPYVNVDVDLGSNFRFEGAGADLRLAGELTVKSVPSEQPEAFGTVRVVDGTYEAFGAKLAIERGVINFQGPFTNPNVNIVAMRRDQDVAAGVQVTGTAQQPRVELVSEPSVPDAEKLSWLVFGHGTATAGEAGGAQAAARGAALGLLNKFGGAPVAKRFGLDELSIGASEFGLGSEQVVNLGKEISNRLYVGYEQSLAGGESVVKLTYEISRHWSTVLRGGAVTGLDLLYSNRFDHIGEK